MQVGSILLLIAGLLVTVACGSEATRVAEETQLPTPPETGNASTTAAGSCVAQYTLEALKNRDYAFDGTVRSIDPGAGDSPDRVTFEVHKWYEGGSGNEAVRRAYGFTAVTSAGGSPYATGERLLVAGDEDFVWECGFTQRYDESTASEWERTFGS